MSQRIELSAKQLFSFTTVVFLLGLSTNRLYKSAFIVFGSGRPTNISELYSRVKKLFNDIILIRNQFWP